MADLIALAKEVAGLKKQESNDFNFMDALDHIEEAAGDTSDADIDQLGQILNSFRSKLPDRETLNPDRIRAGDLAEALTLKTVQARVGRISARKETLVQLNSTLQTQVEKANGDANLLKNIKDSVDKGTKTVAEAKSLVDKLTATDVAAKDKLKDLIESLGKISSIFKA